MFKSTVKRFASYNRNIRMLLLGNIFIQSGLGIFMVIYNFYIRELGSSDNVNGQVISYGFARDRLALDSCRFAWRQNRKKKASYLRSGCYRFFHAPEIHTSK
ncbi:hypothetical protein SAMN05443252_102546 [Bacillus sp. OV322]|nr:hypothetical protein SAMN05443252_102546 [Bacillus sp. OV322]